MFELHQLKQFVAIVECKTLSKAAVELNITQPALTRSLQNLEEELGVKLFNRFKNRIEINENGMFTYEYAKKFISMAYDMESAVEEFNRKNSTISIGSCAPLPRFIKLKTIIADIFPEVKVEIEVRPVKILLEGIKDGTYQIIVLPDEPSDQKLDGMPFFQEKLYAILDKNSSLITKQKEISFNELKGQTILLMPLPGYWNDLVSEKVKEAHFLSQENIGDYEKVVQSSTLISFTSDHIMRAKKISDNRVALPVSDKCAEVNYTFVCLHENIRRFEPLFSKLKSLMLK